MRLNRPSQFGHASNLAVGQLGLTASFGVKRRRDIVSFRASNDLVTLDTRVPASNTEVALSDGEGVGLDLAGHDHLAMSECGLDDDAGCVIG